MQKTVSNQVEITQALSRAMAKKFPKARVRAAARVAGRMNGYERSYSQLLDSKLAAGEIAGWFFETRKFRLADDTWYTPDFEVLMADGAIEYHEIKACQKNGKVLVEDDAQVKLKVAAEMYPHFTFRRVALWRRKMHKDVWKIETYNTV
jgi:hypothetical protein